MVTTRNRLRLTGVGGVHRGGENSMDISADLVELGKTPMAGVVNLQLYSDMQCLA